MTLISSIHNFLLHKQNSVQSFHKLEKAFLSLHRGYTSGTHENMPLRTHEEIIAYTIVRRPATLAAINKVLDRLEERMPNHNFSTCLDIGCGPLTAVEAVVSRYSNTIRRIRCIESHPLFCQFIEDACRAIHTDRDNEVDIELIKGNMGDTTVWQKVITDEKFDVAIASYSLGELSSSLLSNVVEKITEASKVAIIIEPGTPRGWETILAVRNVFISSGKWRIVAPCPHEKECPLLRQTGVWCHEYARVGRSKEHRLLKSGVHGYEDEPFTYLVACSNSCTEELQQQNYRRVIHRPQHRSGHTHVVLCSEGGGLREETVSKKNKTTYQFAKKLEWGDSMPSPFWLQQSPEETKS